MMVDEKRLDGAVLFPEVRIEGYTVRPWTLAQFVEVSVPLEEVLDVLKKEGVSDLIFGLLRDSETTRKGKVSDNKPEVLPVDLLALAPSLVLKCVRHVPRILSVTLGISEEEIGRFHLGVTTAILLAIGTQNYEFLKNYFGPDRKEEKKAG